MSYKDIKVLARPAQHHFLTSKNFIKPNNPIWDSKPLPAVQCLDTNRVWYTHTQTMTERPFESPEFEKRAEAFIEEVRTETQSNDDSRYRQVSSVRVGKYLPGAIRGLDKLQSLVDYAKTEFTLRPRYLSDVYDIKSANSCVVEFSATFNSRRALGRFVERILQIAEAHGGQIDETILPLLTTVREDDYIRAQRGNYGYHFRTLLFFEFSSSAE